MLSLYHLPLIAQQQLSQKRNVSGITFHLCFRILDLQKDRFFEELQAKYWNHSGKGKCPNSDDSEGITLESLGK